MGVLEFPLKRNLRSARFGITIISKITKANESPYSKRKTHLFLANPYLRRRGSRRAVAAPWPGKECMGVGLNHQRQGFPENVTEDSLAYLAPISRATRASAVCPKNPQSQPRI